MNIDLTYSNESASPKSGVASLYSIAHCFWSGGHKWRLICK